MQPTLKFKKPLLAGALLLGTGITFSASADTFTVTAGAIPDVGLAFVTGFETLSFGDGIKGTLGTCSMGGATGIADAVLKLDQGDDGETPATANFGALSGDACIASTDGTPVVIEITGAVGATVSVSVPDVTGAGFTYTPSAESCVVDFDGQATADSCVSLATNTVPNVGMNTYSGASGLGATAENGSTAAYQYGTTAFEGKTRMVLAGSLIITSEIASGTPITDSILVQVTYE